MLLFCSCYVYVGSWLVVGMEIKAFFLEIRTTRLFIVLGNIKKEIVFADFAQFCTFCTDLFLLMPKYSICKNEPAPTLVDYRKTCTQKLPLPCRKSLQLEVLVL